MNRFLILLIFMIEALSLSSCLLPNEKGEVSLSLSTDDQVARDRAKKSRVIVKEVKLVNDHLVITGSDLDSVTKTRISQSGSTTILSIISQTSSELIVNSTSKVAFALNSLMSLTLEDAYGATVIEVTFNLADSSITTNKIGDDQITTVKIANGAITAVKLDQMSASIGQLLRWNGSIWVASDLDALTYAGTWDASTGGSPNPSAVGGEYYIVSTSGTNDPGDGNSRYWAQGDWIIFNDNTISWDQISNSSDVTSFEGRTGGVSAQAGDYTWAMINKSNSSIGDISDVDLSIPATNGKVLKFDGSSWVAADDLSGTAAGSVSSSEIADGSIVNADISSSAAIDWSKINKTAASPSDIGLGNVTNDTQLKAADLDNTITLGTSSTKVPSQNAVKSYVDNAVSAMGSVTSITGGAALNDGPITSTGTLDVQVDANTIEVAADALQLKDGGITNAKVSNSAAIAWSKINKTGAAKSDVGLSNVDNIQQIPLSYLDTNNSLGSDNSKVPSQNAVKNYVDAQVGGVISSQWITSGTDIYYNSGHIGIGTSSPDSNFEVKGNFSKSLSGTVDVGSGSSALIGNGTSFDTELNVGDAIKVGLEVFTISAIADATNLTLDSNHSAGVTGVSAYSDSTLLSVRNADDREVITIHGNGKIGINELSPIADIHIKHAKGDGQTATLALQGTNNSTSWQVGVGSDLGKIEFYGNDSQTSDVEELSAMIMAESESSVTNGSSVTGNLSFHTKTLGDLSLSEKMRVTASGNVGIGEINPASKLDVNGTITASSFAGDGSNLTGLRASTVAAGAGTVGAPSISFSSDTDTGFYTSSANQISVSTNGTNIFNFTDSAFVSPTTGGATVITGNGTSTVPTYSFAGDEDTGWFRPADNELSSTTGGSERMRIDSTGKVGIGTSTPAQSLDVNGKILSKSAGGVIDPDYRLWNVITDEQWQIKQDISANEDLIFKDVDSSINVMTLQNDTGNVGIGTTAPSEKLDVLYDSSAGTRRFRTHDAKGVKLDWGGSGGYSHYYGFSRNSGANDWGGYGMVGSGGSFTRFFTGRSSSDATLNITDGTLASGKVGIGTTSPLSKMQINNQDLGTSWYESNVDLAILSSDARLNLVSSDAAKWGSLISFKQVDETVYENAWSIVRETDGDGTGDGSLHFKYGTSNDDTANTTLVHFTSAGNVGIGTVRPDVLFDVKGRFQVDQIEETITTNGISNFFSDILETTSTYPSCNGVTRVYDLGVLSVKSASTTVPNWIRVKIHGNHRGYTNSNYVEEREFLINIGDRVSSHVTKSSGNAKAFLYNNSSVLGNYYSWNYSAGDKIQLGINENCGSSMRYKVELEYYTPNALFIPTSGGISLTATSAASELAFPSNAVGVHINTNKVGIGTTSISSKLTVDGAISGGFGATTTAGTLDWNDLSNTKSGNAYTLLTGNAANGPFSAGQFFHPFNFEYNTKDGTGNITQLAIPYALEGSIDAGLHMRGRYNGTWSNWVKVLSENTSGNIGVGKTGPMDGKITIDSGLGSVGLQLETSAIGGPNTPALRFKDGDGSITAIRQKDGDLTFGSGWYNERMRIESSTGNIGIGTTGPSYKLDVNGTLRAFGITDSSDKRLKENIVPMNRTEALDKITQLKGVHYFWKDRSIDKHPQIGLIAQNVRTAFPEAVSEGKDGFLSVAYGKLIAPVIESIKEIVGIDKIQNRELASLREENEKIKKENKNIKESMKEIKAIVCELKPDKNICHN